MSFDITENDNQPKGYVTFSKEAFTATSEKELFLLELSRKVL